MLLIFWVNEYREKSVLWEEKVIYHNFIVPEWEEFLEDDSLRKNKWITVKYITTLFWARLLTLLSFQNGAEPEVRKVEGGRRIADEKKKEYFNSKHQ